MAEKQKQKLYKILDILTLIIGLGSWVLSVIFGKHTPTFCIYQSIVMLMLFLNWQITKKQWYYSMPKEFR